MIVVSRQYRERHIGVGIEGISLAAVEHVLDAVQAYAIEAQFVNPPADLI